MPIYGGNVEAEIAWAAGFFDGEGHTGVHRPQGKKYKYLRVQVTQKDRRPLERFLAVVGRGTVGKRQARDGVSDWRVSSAGALDVLQLLWPYLSAPKREQAVRALAEVDRGTPAWAVL